MQDYVAWRYAASAGVLATVHTVQVACKFAANAVAFAAAAFAVVLAVVHAVEAFGAFLPLALL